MFIDVSLIGARTGGSKHDWVTQIMRDTLVAMQFDGEVRIVRYKKKTC